MEIQRTIQYEDQWSIFEVAEEMTDEQIDAMIHGASMAEKKVLTKTLNYETGMELSYFSLTRVIGYRSYTAKQSITDGEEKEELIETEMDDFELENFKNEWEEKWNPNWIEPGIFARFLTMLNPFDRSMEIQRYIQFEQQRSIIEVAEEMTEEQIDAMVDGALMTEKKDLNDSYLSHKRVIGDRSYTAKQSIPFKQEWIETEMDDFELENFKNEWEEKWNPTIREDEPGICARFFTMLKPFN